MRKALGSFVLWLFRWTAEGAPPAIPKYVIIAAPHTSNWDFIFVLAFAAHFGVRISWLGKKEMFRPPFGGLLRALGGVAVTRSRKSKMVDRLAELFEEHDELQLVVPVEGTRGHVDYWKSGFYHTARAAGVPIVMSYLDYPRKRGGFGPQLVPSGDVVADMDKLRAFYGDKQGRHPSKTGRIRIKEEDAELRVTGT